MGILATIKSFLAMEPESTEKEVTLWLFDKNLLLPEGEIEKRL